MHREIPSNNHDDRDDGDNGDGFVEIFQYMYLWRGMQFTVEQNYLKESGMKRQPEREVANTFFHELSNNVQS